MKIIVALNNKYVKDELEKIYKDSVYKYDICDKESVIEYLNKSDFEDYKDMILITKDSLPGGLNGKLYVNQIRQIAKELKIIYVVENLSMEYKKFLFSNEILNIIEGKVVDINNIKEIINTNRFIVYKNNMSRNEKPKVVSPKESIAICGTNGSGKSVVASFIAKALSENLNNLVALLDMNVYNPSIDIINNLEVNSNILGQIVEDVDKYKILDKKINNYLLNDNYNKRLSYMTNNVNAFELKNNKYNNYYSSVINKISNEYDISIIDLPSNPFLDIVNYTFTNCTKILFVINPNYISVRQAVRYLDIITNLYNISKDKIGIVVNKVTRNSLDNIQIKSLLKGYKVLMNIPYDKNIESLINGEYESVSIKSKFDKLYEFLGIDKNEMYFDKLKLIKSLLISQRNLKVSKI